MKRLLSAALLAVALISPALSFGQVEFKRTEDLIYGRKFGTALTMDVIQPEKANGYGVIWIISGGFFSSKEAINPKFVMPLLSRGYTIFAIVHGSQPRYIIPEIQQDIHRGVRYVKLNAGKYGANPDKLGVIGGSAGGHLSLTLATQGGPGKKDAKDPIDRESSAVAAVACFFPPTDFRNWGKEGDDAVGVGTLKQFKPAFGSRVDTAESRETYGKEISPFEFIHGKMPPSLIIHGDADKLVPIYQAQVYEKKATAAGSLVKLVTRPGKDHGWAGMDKDLAVFADWFDEHLRGIKVKEPAKGAE